MSDLVTVVAAVAVAAYVVGRQLIGEPLRGRRVVRLPAILAIIGVIDLHSSSAPVRPVDVGLLAIGAVIAAAVGLAQGQTLRLESRDGSLWGQLPPKGLWLWLLLVGSRVGLTVVAHGLNAQLAASTATILLMLGINRLAQAAVVVPRARSAGIAFAPEKDGTSFLSGIVGPHNTGADGVR
jgi:hypothetical protein